MQARAILTAAVRCAEPGTAVFPEIMIPLVAFPTEYEAQAALVNAVAEQVFAEHGLSVEYSVGTMKVVNGSINMPPNTGSAMALATSAPRPVAASTGTNAASVVMVVIVHGRIRFSPAS